MAYFYGPEAAGATQPYVAYHQAVTVRRKHISWNNRGGAPSAFANTTLETFEQNISLFWLHGMPQFRAKDGLRMVDTYVGEQSTQCRPNYPTISQVRASALKDLQRAREQPRQ